MPKKTPSQSNGFSIIEIILSGALFSLFVTVLIGALHYGEESVVISGNRMRAAALADEGIEALRNIRDENFSNLNNGTFGLQTQGNQWILAGTEDTTGIFTRTVTISTVDTKTKQVSVAVDWQQNLQRTGAVSLVSYLTNWRVLGMGNWSSPVIMSSVDLPGNHNAKKIRAAGNYAYIVRENGEPNFHIVDISNPLMPITLGSLGLSGNLTDISVSGNYAYISSEDNNRELQIVDITDPLNPFVAGTYNAAGNANANSLAYASSTILLVRAQSGDKEFLTIDVALPGSPALLGSLDLPDTSATIKTNGSHAYVASEANAEELEIISLANLSSPTLVGTYNNSGNTNATALDIFGSMVVLGFSDGSVHAVNVSNHAAPEFMGSFNAGDTINDICIGGSYAFLATQAGSQDINILDVSSPGSLISLGTLNTTGTPNSIAYDSVQDRAFLATSGNSSELEIIGPE